MFELKTSLLNAYNLSVHTNYAVIFLHDGSNTLSCYYYLLLEMTDIWTRCHKSFILCASSHKKSKGVSSWDREGQLIGLMIPIQFVGITARIFVSKISIRTFLRNPPTIDVSVIKPNIVGKY